MSNEWNIASNKLLENIQIRLITNRRVCEMSVMCLKCMKLKIFHQLPNSHYNSQ